MEDNLSILPENLKELIKNYATQEDIDALEPGINIIGGKKVIVK